MSKLVWNGEGQYVDTDDDETFAPVDEETGEWVFFHVCCHCWTVHDTRMSVEEDGRLKMRWLDPDPGAVRGIGKMLRKDKGHSPATVEEYRVRKQALEEQEGTLMLVERQVLEMLDGLRDRIKSMDALTKGD